MDLKGILSISGFPGLFKLINQTRNGIIVESLLDGKRKQAFATSKISSLEDIAIYTEGEDVPLVKILKALNEQHNGVVNVTAKTSNEEIKNIFAKALPEYDKQRVYVSDMKRVINWYNLLVEKNVLSFDDEKAEVKTEENTAVSE